MSTLGVARSQESIFDELLRPSNASSMTTSTNQLMSNSLLTNSQSLAPVFSTQQQQQQLNQHQQRDVKPPLPAASLTAEKSGRLRLGKRPLAGIVISSGPGGHFETYEGTHLRSRPAAPPSQDRQKRSGGGLKSKPTSLLRVNNRSPDTTTTTTTSLPFDPETNTSSVTAAAAVGFGLNRDSFHFPVESFSTCQTSQLSQPTESHFPDLTELTREDITSFFSSVPTFQPTSLIPDQVQSMHVPSFSLPTSCDDSALFEQQEHCDLPEIEVGDTDASDLFVGKGKYFPLLCQKCQKLPRRQEPEKDQLALKQPRLFIRRRQLPFCYDLRL